MSSYLHNLRRRPRAPLRLRVEILHGGASCDAETQDLGPGGCLLSAPRTLAPGAQLRLVLRCQGVQPALEVPATVAWSREAMAGVAFTPRQLALSMRPDAWFQRVLAAHPALASGIARAPDRLALDARLYVLPVPREVPRFSADEAALLRLVLAGPTVQGALSSCHLPEPRAARALFALLEKNVVTLSMGRCGEAWKWRAALAADDGLRAQRPPSADPRPGLAAAPRQSVPAASGVDLPTPPHTPAPASPVAPPAAHGEAAAEARPALLRGVTGARRSPVAQARLDEARAAADAGRIDQAVALVRRALALAPRDAEIARLLGQLAFKDRKV